MITLITLVPLSPPYPGIYLIDNMVIGVVEFSSVGTKLERFLPKNQHTQRKLMNFENWCKGEVSKNDLN